MADKGNKLYSPGYLQWFERMDVPKPLHLEHGVNTEDIGKNLKRLNTTNWKLEGNVLTAETEMGKLTQKVPTDVILTGEDAEGLPVFKKIVL